MVHGGRGVGVVGRWEVVPFFRGKGRGNRGFKCIRSDFFFVGLGGGGIAGGGKGGSRGRSFSSSSKKK